ncbi:hypothetical protein SAMN05518865_12816 [Duganella sp. CF458]|uniref:hypothetical protein n=1 Tax=Duganella sp. CF458 TaxID=1884368 RepID=UPI0008E16CEC|nr:hypothetical protein [Duganella sp. CF458]SFH00042.1 hypothetical protein SAMN05518865_12816 [Duganella sp. CF458]
MESLRRFAAIVRADLLERVRTRAFLAVLGGAAALTWLCLPPASAGYIILGLDGHQRGSYSSAWIGMVLGMLATWVSLVGFYLVRGTIRRDIDSGVWQLLEVTPLSRPAYVLAKWSSHLLVFALLLGVQLLVGVLAQWARAEEPALRLGELLKPALLLALPSLALTATLAVWFDLLPWLRRTGGNVVYFVLWVLLLVASVASQQGGAPAGGLGDPRGIGLFQAALQRQPAAPADARICLGCGLGERPVQRFAWPSWQPSAGEVGGRAAWLGLSLAGVLLAAPLVNRLARRATPGGSPQAQGGRRLALLQWLLRSVRRGRLGTTFAAEVEMPLRQRPGWWWAAVLAAWAGQLGGDAQAAGWAVLAAWVLLLDIFARAPLLEREAGSAGIVLSAPGARWRVPLARWLALVWLALLAVAPALLRALAEPALAAGLLLSALSLPAGAMALGALSGSERPFELLACVLVYLGVQGQGVLNPAAASGASLLFHLAVLPLALLMFRLGWPRLHGLPRQ